MLEAGGLDHVVFTGSTEVGREIAKWGASAMTPTTLELSGRDSAIVLDDADPALAAKTIWHGFTMNAGQTCMAPRRVLVQRNIYGEFVRALGLFASSAGSVTLIDKDAANHCTELVRDAIRAGGRSLSTVVEDPDGRRMRPLAVVDCPREAELVGGAHFGPVIAVVPVAGEDDMLSVHRACEQHLSAAVFTKNHSRARKLAPRLGASIITINDELVPSAHPGTPIAGRGLSGWGASQGVDGLLALTRPVHISRTGCLRLPTSPDPRAPLPVLSRFIARFYGGRIVREQSGESAAEPTTGGS